MMLKSKALMNTLAKKLFMQHEGGSGTSFQEHVRRISRRLLPMLGWPGILAISLFAVCLPFYFSTIRPLQERLNMSQRIEDSLREQKIHGEKIHQGPTTPNEELDEFYKHFQSEKSFPHWMGKLVEVADKNGLSLNHGEYVVTQDKVGHLRRFKITLPVQCNYQQIRKFLSAMNAEIPNVALENVQFERKDILDADLQVKIRLLLYMVQDS